MSEYLDIAYKIVSALLVIINLILVIKALKIKVEKQSKITAEEEAELNTIITDNITFALNNIKDICKQNGVNYKTNVTNKTVKQILKNNNKGEKTKNEENKTN